jgi:hypothetical protein
VAQAYKVGEEETVAAAVSVPACALVFYLVRLQGSFLLFWLIYLVSVSISVGACRTDRQRAAPVLSALYVISVLRAATCPSPDSSARAWRRPAALALFSGALSSSIDTAGALLPSYSTALLYFSGFLIPFGSIPSYWKWFSVVDWIRYAW